MGIINFQKSKTSAEDILFTINLGVSSSLIRKFQGEDLTQKPTIEDAHWRIRIGFLLLPKQDFWWKIDKNTITQHIASDVESILETKAIPEIEKHITDENLEEMWLNGISEGLTEFQRYIHLTTLLRLHKKENAGLIINDFLNFAKGKAFEASAKVHIKTILEI